MRVHGGPAQLRELARAAHVILVEVRQHDVPYVAGAQPESGDRIRDLAPGAGRARVDEGRRVAVTPEIGLSDGEAQQVQLGKEFGMNLDDVHVLTLGRHLVAGEGS